MHRSRFGCTKSPLVNAADFPFSLKLGGNARPLQPLGTRRLRETPQRIGDETNPIIDTDATLSMYESGAELGESDDLARWELHRRIMEEVHRVPAGTAVDQPWGAA